MEDTINLKHLQDELEFLVNIDSGTYVKAGVNRIAEYFSDKFKSLGWQIRWYETDSESFGRSFVCAPRLDDDFDVLVLCHTDTVFPEGEAIERPFSRNTNRFYGPGVADMKIGLLFTWYALEELVKQDRLKKNIAVFFNAEHEVSCPNTGEIIKELAKKSKIAITSEPARTDGSYVYKKSGIGRYTFTFKGRAAHSGVNPRDGRDAIEEMAYWVIFLKSLADPEQGIYLNAGMVGGGKSVNAVADHAELKLDLRFTRHEDGLEVDRIIRSKTATPFNADIHIELVGGIKRPPLIPVPATARLQRVVEEIGHDFGQAITWVFSGGGSDASFASAMGIPALCGLAAVGGGQHSQDEYIETGDLSIRYNIFREMLYRFSNLDLNADSEN